MKKLTPIDEKAIVAAYAAGKSVSEIAKDHGISRQWASKIVNTFKRQSDSLGELDTVNYKARLKRKAITAVECGLDAPDDPYKRSRIGVDVLQGIGELASGKQVQVDTEINIVFQWGPVTKPEYLPKDNVIDVTPDTHDGWDGNSPQRCQYGRPAVPRQEE